uniref:Uncharacterized protein n=1 Tax=Oryza meridionalis TaxID=40149 RepID=A0A0E0D8V1_9ORYZ
MGHSPSVPPGRHSYLTATPLRRLNPSAAAAVAVLTLRRRKLTGMVRWRRRRRRATLFVGLKSIGYGLMAMTIGIFLSFSV